MANLCIDGIQVGNLVRASATFTNAIDNYNPIDPSIVNCTVTKPDGTATTYIWGPDPEVSRTGVGLFYLEDVVDQAGTWFFKWTGDGTVVCTTEVSLRVLSTN